MYTFNLPPAGRVGGGAGRRMLSSAEQRLSAQERRGIFKGGLRKPPLKNYIIPLPQHLRQCLNSGINGFFNIIFTVLCREKGHLVS